MNRSIKMLMLCGLVMFLLAGCHESSLAMLTKEQQAVFYLVSVPFAIGIWIGLSPLAFSGCSVAVASIVLIPSILSLLPQFLSSSQVTPSLNFRFFGMATVWVFLGIYVGYRCAKHIRLVGPRGYLFSFLIAFIGVCLSSLVIDGILPQILGNKSIDAQKAVGAYGFLLIMSVLGLTTLSEKLTVFGVQTVIKQVLSVFTIFGLLDFLAEYQFDNLLSNILWWIPNVQPPSGYEFVFTLAMAGVAAVRSKQLSEDSRITWKLDKEGMVVVKPEAFSSRSKNPFFPIISYTYKIPEGWVVAHKKADTMHHNLWLEPAHKTNDEMIQKRIELLVVQHPDLNITEQDLLKRVTYLNVLGPYRDGSISILTDRFVSRYGVISHECIFKQGMKYKYLGWFVIHGNAFVIQRIASEGEIFDADLEKLVEFTDNLCFELSNNGSKEI